VVLMLVVSPTLTAGGAVRRDPVSGKWVDVTDNDVVADPRSRRGGGDDDGGFFGGLAFVDNRSNQIKTTKPSTIESLPSLSNMDLEAGVMTRELTPRTSKYSAFIPIQSNIQTDTATFNEQEGLIQQSSSYQATKIQSFVHEVPDDISAVQLGASAPLTTKPIGTLCRFQGFAPLTACPSEAGGCVDRIPCKRTCQQDGFFSYRCKGPQIVSQAYANAAAQQTPVPRPPSEDYVTSLTGKLKNAMQANDYTALARLIVNAQQGRSGSAAAASALAQISQEIVSTNGEGVTNDENIVPTSMDDDNIVNVNESGEVNSDTTVTND